MVIKGKRLFNYRPMCVCFVALLAGMLIAESLYQEHLAFLLLPLALFLSLLIAFAIKKKLRRFLYIPIVFIIGFSSMSISNAVYDKNLAGAYQGEFCATISSDIIVSQDGVATMYVSDILIDGKYIKYDGYAKISFDGDVNFHVGDVIRIDGSLTPYKHTKFSTNNASNRANHIAYTIKANMVDVVGNTKLRFPLNLQIAIKKLFYQQLDEKTASICSALLLGDKHSIDSVMYSHIKTSGLAHVLAVSGLHISLLASLVYSILKKLKVNSKISFAIVVISTFVYSMLCSFTASSLRAFIMTGVGMMATTFGHKRDDLSNLSFSAILILLFRPTAIMEIGFLLSYSAVMGIFTCHKPFERVGMKIVDKISPKHHFGKRFASVCALSFATNLMTFPFVAHFFTDVPTLFILSNFIVLPYVMASYILLILFTVLSLIFQFGGFVWLMKFVLLPFRIYVGAIGSLSFASVPISIGLGGTTTFLLDTIVLSKYVFLTRRQKVCLALLISAIGMAISTLIAFV